MDEIGFLVNFINKQGYAYVDPVGGFDPRNLFSRRVKICTDSGDYKGVMNPIGKPVHTQSALDRKRFLKQVIFSLISGLVKKQKTI